MYFNLILLHIVGHNVISIVVFCSISSSDSECWNLDCKHVSNESRDFMTNLFLHLQVIHANYTGISIR